MFRERDRAIVLVIGAEWLNGDLDDHVIELADDTYRKSLGEGDVFMRRLRITAIV